MTPATRPLIALVASMALVGCGTSIAQTSTAPSTSGHSMGHSMNHNSIQPETTLTVSASGDVARAPDMATITLGVQTEAKTASEAMSQNASKMEGVYAALAAAGIAERDMQTSNLSLQPRYDYSNRDGSPPKVTGYTASNQVTVKVRNLDNLGQTLDAIVADGGNTISGLSFGLQDASEARDEARRNAIKTAMSRAELYAAEAGYSVARIVTINETSSDRGGPVPMMAMRAESDSSTQISGGEVGYQVQVNVTFELAK